MDVKNLSDLNEFYKDYEDLIASIPLEEYLKNKDAINYVKELVFQKSRIAIKAIRSNRTF